MLWAFAFALSSRDRNWFASRLCNAAAVTASLLHCFVARLIHVCWYWQQIFFSLSDLFCDYFIFQFVDHTFQMACLSTNPQHVTQNHRVKNNTNPLSLVIILVLLLQCNYRVKLAQFSASSSLYPWQIKLVHYMNANDKLTTTWGHGEITHLTKQNNNQTNANV